MRIIHGRSIKENNAPWSLPRSNNSFAIRVPCSERKRNSVANKIHRAREREKERKRRKRERERGNERKRIRCVSQGSSRCCFFLGWPREQENHKGFCEWIVGCRGSWTTYTSGTPRPCTSFGSLIESCSLLLSLVIFHFLLSLRFPFPSHFQFVPFIK